MNKKFTKYFATFLLLLIGFLNAKDLNIKALEKEITKYNREGKQKDSQKRLFDLLLVGNLTKEEKANVFFYMGTTYRSVDDYLMCIDYLNRSYNIAKKLPKDNALRMKLDYEYAFSYFDNKEFDKSSKMMSRIANENYINAIPENQSYILLQEGYLFLRENQFDRAELKYEQALDMPQNGVIQSPLLKYTDDKHGYNMIGNPYPSNLDFDKFVAANTSIVNGLAYLWTNNDSSITVQLGSSYTTNYPINNYAMVNRTGGLAATYPGYNNNRPVGFVSVGQAFIIQAKADGKGKALVFDNSMRSTTAANFFNKSECIRKK